MHSHFEAAALLRAKGADMGLSSARLFDANSEIGAKRDAGTLICQVCADGDVKLLTSLLSCGCDPDSHDYDGRTGQHIAASTGDMRMLQLLISRGCNVSVKVRASGPPSHVLERPCALACALALPPRSPRLTPGFFSESFMRSPST